MQVCVKHWELNNGQHLNGCEHRNYKLVARSKRVASSTTETENLAAEPEIVTRHYQANCKYWRGQ